MRKLCHQEYVETRWKNAGGVTRQVLISPFDATLIDFDYRISIATVSSDGPFSIFPCVDRSLLIMEGGALLLSRQNGDRNLLRIGSEALHFTGDERIDCRVIDGPVTDVNVMTRRGFYRHEIAMIRVESMVDYVLMGNDRIHVLLAAGGGRLRIRSEKDGEREEQLHTGDAIVVDGADKVRMQPMSVAGAARIVHVQIYSTA